MPNNNPAIRNSGKLSIHSAKAAISTATTAEREAVANPCARPILRMSIVAGIAVIADASTIIVIGNVAHALSVARVAPIIPPSVTKTIAPVAEISWLNTSMIRLRSCIGRS